MKDNTDEAAQAADNHYSEYGDGPVPSRDRPPIEIFGSAGCDYCVKAKDLCERNYLRYTYKDVDEDEEAFYQLHGRIGSWKTVPQIFCGAEHIGGYDDLLAYFGHLLK